MQKICRRVPAAEFSEVQITRGEGAEEAGGDVKNFGMSSNADGQAVRLLFEFPFRNFLVRGFFERERASQPGPLICGD